MESDAMERKSTQFNWEGVPKAIRDRVKSLPIYSVKEELLKAIAENPMVIVTGGTGSGKSTQIPQYLVEAGFASKGKIGVTQPRRVATKSLTTRVAKESGVELGSLVGYEIRFKKEVSDDTRIKYMTDGVLLRELAVEPTLNSYSVIIIDEFHERSTNTDICCGLLKKAVKHRPDLKIIICSDTPEITKFSKYFNNAPVFKVPGRAFDVEVIYEPKYILKEVEITEGPIVVADYVKEVVDTILTIHETQEEGDVLVFLSCQREIENTQDMLNDTMTSGRIRPEELLILPCYRALAFEEQQKIFETTPKGSRKIILATDIAETSLTIDGIVYVIDCGYIKQNKNNCKSGIKAFVKQKISKQQAIQRAGRAGLTRPGKCYRLYSEQDFDDMKDAILPERKCSNLESVVLYLITVGISNPVTFDFLDPPNEEEVLDALEHLKELQALNEDDLNLTPLGKRMSELPLDPSLSRVLIESVDLGCSDDILKIVSILSTDYSAFLIHAKEKQDQIKAEHARAKFNHPDGDHLTFLHVFDQWIAANYSSDWCKENFLQYRYLCEADQIRKQLQGILQDPNVPKLSDRNGWSQSERIRRAFTAGYFRQIAKKCQRSDAYEATNRLADHEEMYLDSCSLSPHVENPKPFVLYHEVVKTTKAYIRGVTEVKMEWVEEYSPRYFNSKLLTL